MTLDSASENLIKILEQAGFEAYVVGGCVRDSLMGREIGDYDITTSATPDQVETVLEKNNIRFVETGLQHGTVSAIVDSKAYEITTYRTESGYSDNRHPDKVEFVTNLESDLCRRDFTINAMAYNPTVGLVDLFGGREDINARIIRTVGDPDIRFEEDALRMLRALRFSCTLGFVIHGDTKVSILKNADKIKNVADERITAEVLKMIKGYRFGYTLSRYLPIFQNIFSLNLEKFDKTAQSLVRYSYRKTPKDIVQLLAMLWDYIEGEKFEKNAQIGRLKLSRDIAKRTLALVENLDLVLPYDSVKINLLLARYGKQTLLDVAYFQNNRRAALEINRLISINKPYLVSHLAVTGDDLVELGIKGKEVGYTLKSLLESVIKGELPNNKSALIEYLKIANLLK